MIFHKVITQRDGFINAADLDMPISNIGNGGWAGIPGRPLMSYTFLKDGPIYGQLKLPFFAIGEEIHVGKKGDTMGQRLKWEIIDFDEKQILLRRIQDGSHVSTN